MTVAAPEQTTAPVSSVEPSTAKRVLQTVFITVWYVGSLFLAAGTLRWIRGWICVGFWMSLMAILGAIMERLNPQLMAQRSKWHRKDTKRFDKIILAIYLPLSMVQPALAALDAVRFRWSSLPFVYVYIGSTIYLFAAALIGWVLSTNPFAESTVRIQADRGQSVVTSGPYRIVRHPMYVGAILMSFAQAMILGSIWALWMAAAMTLLLLTRTALEDLTLRRELPGYKDYAACTRYRLLPGIW